MLANKIKQTFYVETRSPGLQILFTRIYQIIRKRKKCVTEK